MSVFICYVWDLLAVVRHAEHVALRLECANIVNKDLEYV